jgi:sugar transferase (PEP-CTERM/EpsH1 system associated)
LTDKIAIAHIFLSLKIGGMEKIGTDIIRMMDQSKYDQYIICLDELGHFGEQLKKSGFKTFSLHKGEGFSIALLFKLIQFFKKNKIKIVHTNNPAPHFWGGIAAWLAGVKVRIHTKHGRNFITIKRKVFLNRISACFSKNIVSVSKDSAELTHKIEGVPKRKILTIYNGVDTDYFKKQSVNVTLYEDFKIGRGNIIIGSISRFSQDKDHETLIKSFSEVIKTKPDTVLLLVGDGETKERMLELVHHLHLDNKVIFSGFRSDILDLLNFIDIFVLSTHTEGISISLLEAMSAEKPVIATSVGGNGEIVEHGQNGLLVPENNIVELKEAILLMLENETERQRFSEEARKVVLEKFELSGTVKQYDQLYLKFLNNE